MDVQHIMPFVIIAVTLVNSFHWIQRGRSKFLWLPTSGWPQTIFKIGAVTITVIALLSLLDLVPFQLSAIFSAIFCLAHQIYSIFAREHHHRKPLEPASGPLVT